MAVEPLQKDSLKRSFQDYLNCSYLLFGKDCESPIVHKCTSMKIQVHAHTKTHEIAKNSLLFFIITLGKSEVYILPKPNKTPHF